MTHNHIWVRLLDRDCKVQECQQVTSRRTVGRLRVEGNLHQWRKVPAEDGEINRRVTGKVRSNNYQLPSKRQAKQDKRHT